MTLRLPDWLYRLLWVNAFMVLIAGLARWQQFPARDGVAPVFLIGAGVVMAALLVRTVRVGITEVRSTPQPWWRTPAFLQVGAWGGLVILLAALTFTAVPAVSLLDLHAGSDRLSMIILGLTFLLSGIARVLATRAVQRRGGDLLHGTPDLIGRDAWCQRNLGVWWTGQLGIRVAFGIIAVVWLTPSPYLLVLVFPGHADAVAVAHAFGLTWPVLERRRDLLRHGYLRMRALASPAGDKLRRRNLWILTGSFLVMVPAWIALYAIGAYFDINGPNNTHEFWVTGMVLPLMVADPAAYILVMAYWLSHAPS